jgi:hypothetical protein
MDLIPPDTILSFYTEEIRTASDYWRIEASFNALSTAVLCYKDSLCPSLVEQAIDAAQECSEVNVLPIRNAFLHACTSASHKEGMAWIQLMAFALEGEFSCQTIATLINDGEPDQVLDRVEPLLLAVTDALAQKVVEPLGACAMITLLFEKSEEVVVKCLRFFEDGASQPLSSLKLDLYRRAIRRCKTEAVLPFVETVAQLAWSRFKQGGMIMMAQVLAQNPEIGVALVTFDNLQVMHNFCMADIANCAVFLQFVRFGYGVYHKMNRPNPEFEISVVKIGLESL